MGFAVSLAGALALAAAAELPAPETFAPLPAGWAAALVVAPALLAAVRRWGHRASPASHLGRRAAPLIPSLVFLVAHAVVLFPLGWASWTLDVLGWRGSRLSALLLALVPAGALALVIAPGTGMHPRAALSRARLAALAAVLMAAAAAGLDAFPAAEAALDTEPSLTLALGVAAIAILGSLSPLLFLAAVPTSPCTRLVWGRSMRLALVDLSRRMGIAVPILRIWRDGPPSSPNACALGILPPLRLVALTPRLGEVLGPTGVLAVLSHELAHFARRHQLWYLVLAIASVLALGPVDALTGSLPEWAQALVLAALLFAFWRILFGRVSRAFETEADLLAALAVGAVAYAEAMEQVAPFLGPGAMGDGWRHPGMARRLEAVLRSASEPAERGRIQARARRMRFAVAAVLVASVLAYAVVAHGDAVRPAGSIALARAEVMVERASRLRGALVARPEVPTSLRFLCRRPEAIAGDLRRVVEDALDYLEEGGAVERSPTSPAGWIRSSRCPAEAVDAVERALACLGALPAVPATP